MQPKTFHIFHTANASHCFQPQEGGTFFIGVVAGALHVEAGRQHVRLEAGWLLAIPSASVTSVTATQEDARGICWHVDEAWTGLQQVPQPMDAVTTLVLADVTRRDAEESAILPALAYLSARVAPPVHTLDPTPAKCPDLATAVCQYIETNLDEHITLADLCTHFHCSRARLARAFRAAGLPSPIKHVAVVRIRHAMQSLQQSDLSIANIAAGLGFRDLSTFSHFFRAHTGYAPREYRRNCHWIQ